MKLLVPKDCHKYVFADEMNKPEPEPEKEKEKEESLESIDDIRDYMKNYKKKLAKINAEMAESEKKVAVLVEVEPNLTPGENDDLNFT